MSRYLRLPSDSLRPEENVLSFVMLTSSYR
jgi:hypothetical protein